MLLKLKESFLNPLIEYRMIHVHFLRIILKLKDK